MQDWSGNGVFNRLVSSLLKMHGTSPLSTPSQFGPVLLRFIYVLWEGHKILQNIHHSILVTGTTQGKSKVEISQNFVAFSEYMNFKIKSCWFDKFYFLGFVILKLFKTCTPFFSSKTIVLFTYVHTFFCLIRIWFPVFLCHRYRTVSTFNAGTFLWPGSDKSTPKSWTFKKWSQWRNSRLSKFYSLPRKVTIKELQVFESSFYLSMLNET